MAKLPCEHVDLVVTSPPYNLGIRYGKFSDRRDRQSHLRWCREWAAQVQRVLKSSASFFLNIGAAPSNPMLPHEMVMELRELFVLQNTIHWVKSIAIDKSLGKTEPDLKPFRARSSRDPGEDQSSPGSVSARRWVKERISATISGDALASAQESLRYSSKEVGKAARSYGHFKPISSKRFLNDCHEYIFHFTKTGRVELDRLAIGVPYQDKSNIARWLHARGSDLRCRGNTWMISYETIQSRVKQRPHPATFPIQLAEWCIKLHGVSRVRTMLDPFLGIGNSALAAQRCGVKEFIGFEIDEEYVAEAKRRIG